MKNSKKSERNNPKNTTQTTNFIKLPARNPIKEPVAAFKAR
jgi:hypothetical protein